MSFEKPLFLLLLLLLPLLTLLAMASQRRRRAALAGLAQPALLKRIVTHASPVQQRWADALWLAAFTLLVIALARPQWGATSLAGDTSPAGGTSQSSGPGIQIMAVLDVSVSMLAQDASPNRLGRAKQEISALIDSLNGNLLGLVLFSGASFIQFPLTNDAASARVFLEAAGPDAISSPGTAIGGALQTALTGFDSGRAGQRVIVLFSDGEDHAGDAISAAQQVAREGVILYTFGVGSPDGSTIPVYDEAGQIIGSRRDLNGQVVVSRLNEEVLDGVARAAGGEYVRLSGSDPGRAAAALLGKVQAGEGSRAEAVPVDRFQPFLLAAVGLLLAAQLLPLASRQGPGL